MSFTCQRAVDLRHFLRTCTSKEFLAEWITIFNEIKSNFDDSIILKSSLNLAISVKACCLLLHDFLQVASKYPAVSKQISLDKAPNLIAQIIRLESYDVYILLALKSFLQYYPMVFNRLSNKTFTSYFFKLIDANCTELKLHAARCLAHHLTIVGPAGEKRYKYAENWQQWFSYLLVTCHNSYHNLVTSLTGSSTKECDFNLNLHPNDTNESAMAVKVKLDNLESTDSEKLVNRIEFCCQTLVALLCSDLSGLQVKLPVEDVLRCLNCFAGALHRHKSMRSEVLKYSLIGLRHYLLVVENIPLLTKLNLIPYCPGLLFNLESILHQMSQISYSYYEYSTGVNCAVYDILRRVATHLGDTSKIYNVVWKLWPRLKPNLHNSSDNNAAVGSPNRIVKEDVTNDVVYLNESGRKGKKRKKSRKSNSDISNNVEPLDFGDQFVRKPADYEFKCQELLAAYRFLTAATTKCGHSFKPSLYRDLQQFACKMSLSLVSSFNYKKSNDGDCNNNGPYHYDTRCQVAVFELLISLVATRHPACPPAVQCAAKILSLYTCKRKGDFGTEIDQICSSGLLLINNITKPRVPSMENRLDIDDNCNARQPLFDAEEESDQVISTLNRIIDRQNSKQHHDADPTPVKSFEEIPNYRSESGTKTIETNHSGKTNGIIDLDDSSQEPIVVDIGDNESPPAEMSAEAVFPGNKMLAVQQNQKDGHDEDCVEIFSAPAVKKVKLSDHLVDDNKRKSAESDVVIGGQHITEKHVHEKTFELGPIDDLIADFVDAPADDEI